MTEPGRNEPCPCGSGKKYKRCCYLTEAPPKAITYNVTALNNTDESLDAVAKRVYDDTRGKVISIYCEGGETTDPAETTALWDAMRRATPAPPTNSDLRYGGRTLKLTILLLARLSPQDVYALLRPSLGGPRRTMTVLAIGVMPDAQADAFWAAAVELERASGIGPEGVA